MALYTLTVEDVLTIHRKIVDDTRGSSKPIAMMRGVGVEPSVKDRGLLESAVARQHAGMRNELFYPTPELNAASLMFGIAKNHAFVDGNKRTALVSMLNHLDGNHITLKELKWKDIESIVLALVTGDIVTNTKLRHVAAKALDRSDRELRCLAEWIRQNSRRIERGEKRMSYNDLEQLLKTHGFEFGKPKGNFIDIFKVSTEIKHRLLGGNKTIENRQHVGTIGYPGGKREIAIFGMKQVRTICRLTENYGIDSAAFYNSEQAIDEIINRYRHVLRSLADQ